MEGPTIFASSPSSYFCNSRYIAHHKEYINHLTLTRFPDDMSSG
ncbi:hypothetical protein HanXRQr2_Chr14g0661001 [Helianthus annuus]|uniref:Uncharacterized protein n=1 Tax=Helianthus annuus TaxID=4232 RepID=A0A9K3EBS7_HELAN|nr:hypothetical protein HanXRQr2_Chr14g0661001 [Helianthus annuus]KAJ0841776.1 hypothetical protein HanPSC8_Chr14g0634211 [Helianthus annuus]